MCHKWFIFKEFYFIFLILESNMGLYHKYSSKWVIKYTKTKESKINESLKKKKCFTIIKKKKEKTIYINFIPNNILTKFFKELTKYKNDHQ